jgi:hypothetical protein
VFVFYHFMCRCNRVEGFEDCSKTMYYLDNDEGRCTEVYIPNDKKINANYSEGECADFDFKKLVETRDNWNPRYLKDNECKDNKKCCTVNTYSKLNFVNMHKLDETTNEKGENISMCIQYKVPEEYLYKDNLKKGNCPSSYTTLDTEERSFDKGKCLYKNGDSVSVSDKCTTKVYSHPKPICNIRDNTKVTDDFINTTRSNYNCIRRTGPRAYCIEDKQCLSGNCQQYLDVYENNSLIKEFTKCTEYNPNLPKSSSNCKTLIGDDNKIKDYTDYEIERCLK